MPLIEITNPHLLTPPFPYHHHHHHHVKPWNWISFRKHNFNVLRTRLPFLIKAVAATIVQPKSTDMQISALNPQHHQPGPGPGTMLDSSEHPLDDKEKLRRLRISKANKGSVPWNKGRKHSPETLQKIKERTRLAMQNPKVKMKLANNAHAQTTETKLKISVGVRRLWEKRRGRKMVQEGCSFEWQNLIAEASRQGFIGEEELQWNSYEMLDDQLKQEWLASAEQRKHMPRAPGLKRLSKSPEQRKKIAQAISAKWADPDYRERVVSAIAKYHHSIERKPKAKPSYRVRPPRKKKPSTKSDSDNSIFVRRASKIVNPIQLKKRKSPAYKDPLVNSKLQMIKNIRAQRASLDTRQTQAIQQARLLIAEAEKAARALEVAAEKSPIAQSSLIESRKLIAEAIRSLESIDTQKTEAIQSLESIDMQKTDDCNVPSVSLSEEVNKENESTFEVGNHSQMAHANGYTTLSSSLYKFSEDIGEVSPERPFNGCASLPFSLNSQIIQYSPSNQERETEQDESSEDKTDHSPAEDETLSKSPIATKRWVRGRLVEASEEKE